MDSSDLAYERDTPDLTSSMEKLELYLDYLEKHHPKRYIKLIEEAERWYEER